MPEPIENIEPTPEIGKSGSQTPPPGQEGGETVVEPKLTPEEEFEARVQSAAQKRIDAEKEEARKQEAASQGNFQLLYENEMKARKKAELYAWRTKALGKHGLADEWFDSLSGETEEEVMKSAKTIKKRIDDAVEATTNALLENPLPPGGGNRRPPREEKKDGKEVTRRNMAAAFNIGNLPRAN
jgi:hypothetical protein